MSSGPYGLGVRSDFEPDGRAVGPTQPQQIVGDDAVADQALEETLAGLRVVEPRRVERPHVGLGRLRREAEHEFEMRVGGERDRACLPTEADVDALVDGLEEPRKRLGAHLGSRPEDAEESVGTSRELYRLEGAHPWLRLRSRGAASCFVSADIAVRAP